MDVSRICADLMAINSENPPGRTDEIIEYIREYLDRLLVKSTISGSDRRYNLVTKGTGRALLLCGQVDVVPAQVESWTPPPFSGAVDARYVWGRGATDMKGSCAAILGACEPLAGSHDVLPATLAFVCDEETDGDNGICRLLDEAMIAPCDCLVAEPIPARPPSIG